MDRNTVKDTVLGLYGQGKPPKQIAAELHIPVQTVYELTQDISKGALDDKGTGHKLQMMQDFPERWIDAINPVRRYYGHEPMELRSDQ
ncbi:hypothetical protein BRYFOR_07590 [Marvinbryantia formatexigens DSM 14469]|uniref:Uncharacterized protein n=1 Tax=Marvinbryantia formatexigens DSM 14469 TaxID=478749 RepID=C6LG30_9FIRM|nr:helix-turn-helix domain-containing protein [Marvinbryantia formatexigens]EET60394.1 hypothetical protein BRYFOR_07590 [Marvinbryantia formatexigens DSM 14469]UWO25266.1 hypothetical protein NQ534_01880 [Marvinbryantia formatexigens DSM 14469]SDH03669.1 hypothetical protein SAMN05660368_03722 [Marvinbryantia formatexigens]